jgi:anthranilate phosphoribosyltransferase
MKQILYKLFEHQYLGRDEARIILQNIAQGKYNDVQVASLITVFLMRNISVEELCGFRDALLEMRVPVDLSEFSPIDIVGTGGDGKNTFNISTAACFTVAGAGFPVVKHGNYGATSVSGASNVMEQHGVKFTNDVDKLRRSMERCNIAYLHAPLFNPALKAVAPVRKSLAVRTFFNMLGPLVNPVLPSYQLLGVYNLPLLRLYSYTYQASNIKFAVVHSLDGYDEISLTKEFKVATSESEKIYTPESLGFSRYTEMDLDGGNTPEDAARIFDNVLANTATEAQKDVVIVNAAFAINVICPEKPIEECIALARESLESGRALDTLKKFINSGEWLVISD